MSKRPIDDVSDAEILRLLDLQSQELGKQLELLKGEIELTALEASGAVARVRPFAVSVCKRLDDLIHRHRSFQTGLWAYVADHGKGGLA